MIIISVSFFKQNLKKYECQVKLGDNWSYIIQKNQNGIQLKGINSF